MCKSTVIKNMHHPSVHTFSPQYAYCLLLKVPMAFKQVIPKFLHNFVVGTCIVQHPIYGVNIISINMYNYYLHTQTQMPHLRNVIATEIEEDKINPYESTHISTPHTSHFKDCSDLSNSPTAFTAGKQDLQDESTAFTAGKQDLQDESTAFTAGKQDLQDESTAFTAGKQDLQDESTAWVNLSKPLQELLPNESGTTYVVTEMETLPTERFLGAPAHAYNATIRINITRPEKVQEWLQSMMKHSKCTYRHTKGRAPGLKRVSYKAEMHCQHKEKSLTLKQK